MLSWKAPIQPSDSVDTEKCSANSTRKMPSVEMGATYSEKRDAQGATYSVERETQGATYSVERDAQGATYSVERETQGATYSM